jgi:hypothetical protein
VGHVRQSGRARGALYRWKPFPFSSLLAGAGAFAAPNDTAKSPSTTSDVVNHPVKHAKIGARHVKHAVKREAHKARVAMHRHHHHVEHTASVPQTSVTDQGRESRMDQALANYRRTHS